MKINNLANALTAGKVTTESRYEASQKKITKTKTSQNFYKLCIEPIH